MRENSDILKLVEAKEAETLWQSQRALILQPGAIGDCILTLPVVKFMKEGLGLGGVDILGHTEYTGILPGRTAVDRVRSIESIDLRRLFAEAKQFHLPDRDPLINFFEEYSWLVTFLGEPESNFEKNLIFTVHCSHSAEVITLSLKPPENFAGHLSDFYIQELLRQSGLHIEAIPSQTDEQLIKANKADTARGRELLEEAGADLSKRVVVIHPGSGGKSKCWYIENFLAVAKSLAAKNIEVVFLLGPAERERFEEATIKSLSETGKCLTHLTLTEVVGLLSCAGYFLGNDSGITHLAAGLGTGTIAIFGPSNPTIYKPVGPKVTVLRGEPATFATEVCEELQRQVLEILETILKD
jgi:heptosyltransferase-3